MKRQGIVVTCSGFDEWIDKMVSGMIAEILMGLAYHAWKNSEEKKMGFTWISKPVNLSEEIVIPK